MSTKALNYGNYVMQDQAPEWFRAERYEYCEPFFERENLSRKKGIHFLVQFVLSLF